MAEKKSNWIAWVAVLALIIAVVALVYVLKGGVTGEAVFSKSTRQINANSCNADGTCEAEVISANGISADIATFGNLRTNLLETSGITATNGDISLGRFLPYASALTITESVTGGPSSKFTGILFADRFEADNIKTDYLSLPRLNGTGRAYVCVDSAGTVFRSQTACR